jgi:hypothetical protein
MYITKRSGFAMILAIFIVVLISLGGVMLLSNASIGPKSIGDKYLRTQAEMLALSATEFAVMRAQDFNTTAGNCLNELNITVQDSSGVTAYNADVTIRYSFNGARPNNQCNTIADMPAPAPASQGAMMLIDAVVTANKNANLSTEPIRVYKRSWQRL